MKTLKVTLKQHTPLIHFQHDQYGATLRVSEVKPKLDKFIIKKAFNDEWERCKEYLVGYKKSKKENADKRKEEEISLNKGLEQKFREGFRTLNYKLKIDTETGDSNCGTGKKIPMYFGNMGDGEKKETIYSKNPINLTFIIDGIFEAILKNNITEFFLVTNFGTRQSKGYGSFYISEKDELFKEPDDYIGVSSYIQTKFSCKCRDWKKAQDIVDIFYKTIRSGINVCRKICSKEIPKPTCKVLKESKVNVIVDKKQVDICKECKHYIPNGSVFYFKSTLFHYIQNKLNKQWDKKTIKNALYNEIYDNEKELYRDLLGLASNTKFGKSLLEKKSDDGIDRYKSPIFIKPIEMYDGFFTFYIGYEDINDGILGTRFNIEIDGEKLLALKTPKEFDINDYFKYLFESQPKCNFTVDDLIGNKRIRNRKTNEEVHPDSKQHQNYELLKDIYAQLRSNYKVTP